MSRFLRQQLRSLTAVERREAYSLTEAPIALSDANEGHGRGKAVVTV